MTAESYTLDADEQYEVSALAIEIILIGFMMRSETGR